MSTTNSAPGSMRLRGVLHWQPCRHAGGPTETEMQLVAREMNNSETAFVFPAMSNDHNLLVRFFTPGMRGAGLWARDDRNSLAGMHIHSALTLRDRRDGVWGLPTEGTEYGAFPRWHSQ